MSKIARLTAICAALVALAPTLVAARPALTGEQQLDKLLAGRVAGKPQECINLFDAQQSQIVDRTAIVFGWGRTIWVNRPENPSALSGDPILVTRPTTSQLCRLDPVRLHDRTGHFYVGFVSLGKFVPYRKPG